MNNKTDLGKLFETFKNKNMKVTIKRIMVPGNEPHFEVRQGEDIVRIFQYKAEAPEGDIYNEAANLAQAKELATKLELGATRVEEIIYETPDDIPAELFTKPGKN